MNASGWIQLALYVGILLLITKPLGIYLFQVLDGRNTFLEPVLGPLERITYKLLRVDSRREQNWKQYTAAMLLFSLVTMAFTYVILRFQDHLPFHGIIDGLSNKTRDDPGPGLQHGRQLYHQHELAELLRREHDELLLADGRPRQPQLLVGGPGHRRGGGAGARHRPARERHGRQLLGGPRAPALLPAAADLHHLCGVPHRAGHPAKLQALRHGATHRETNDPGAQNRREQPAR